MAPAHHAAPPVPGQQPNPQPDPPPTPEDEGGVMSPADDEDDEQRPGRTADRG